MKKKFIALSAIVVVVLTAFMVGCSVNGSPSDVTTAFLKASGQFDAQGVCNCVYYLTDDDKKTDLEEGTEAFNKLKESFDEFSISFDNVTYAKSGDMTELEIKALNAMCYESKAEIEAGEKGTITYDITVKISGEIEDQEISMNTTQKNQKFSVRSIKIDGKWYIDPLSNFSPIS